MACLDNPMSNADIVKSIFKDLGKGLLWHDGIMDDPLHLIYARVSKWMHQGHPLYCKFIHEELLLGY